MVSACLLRLPNRFQCRDMDRTGHLANKSKSNFLPLPTKRSVAIPDLGPKLLSYITTNFRDAHPEAFKRDVEQFVTLRREWVEGKGEAHPEGVKGLMRYVDTLLRLLEIQSQGCEEYVLIE